MSNNKDKTSIDADSEDVLRVLLKYGGISKSKGMSELGITDAQFTHAIKRLRAKKFYINYSRSSDRYTVRMGPGLGAIETKVVSEIDRLGLTDEEIGHVLSSLRDTRSHVYAPKRVAIGDECFKFGVISDLHIGHKKFRPDVLTHAIENFRLQDVDFVVNCGDTLEGMTQREGHPFHLDRIGVPDDENGRPRHGIGMGPQKRLFAHYFQPFVDYGIKVHSIEADGSHTTWGMVKGNQGEDIGPELEMYCKAYEFIGYLENDLVTDSGIIIRLRHPGRGSAQTYSHMLQKYIKDLSGGDKPNILFNGHFHKNAHVTQRNILGWEAMCMQDQTQFMKKIPTPAHVGYRIFTVWPDGTSVSRIANELVQFYD